MIMRQRSALLATVVTSVGLHARFRRLSLLLTSPSLTYLSPIAQSTYWIFSDVFFSLLYYFFSFLLGHHLTAHFLSRFAPIACSVLRRLLWFNAFGILRQDVRALYSRDGREWLADDA